MQMFGIANTAPDDYIGYVSLAPNGERRCLACASCLRQSHDRGWVVSRCNRAKTAKQYLLRGETGLAASTPVVRLSLEPPCDPNQSSAPPVIDFNRLTPGEAKETHS